MQVKEASRLLADSLDIFSGLLASGVIESLYAELKFLSQTSSLLPHCSGLWIFVSWL